MFTAKFLPYDRIISKEGIVFEVQSGYKLADKTVIVRPKYFPVNLYEPNLGNVYSCDNHLFKIPVKPLLYILSGCVIKKANNGYCIPELEDIGIKEYYEIPLEQIVQHFTPRDRFFFQRLPKNKVEKKTKELIELLDAEGFAEVVGIGGSAMMGLTSEFSDIDLVIYGLDKVEHVMTFLREVVDIGPRTADELKSRYMKLSEQFRAFMSFEEYRMHEFGKSHRGYVDGIKLTINIVDPVKHPYIVKGSFYDITDFSGEVIDDRLGITHPSEVIVKSDTKSIRVVSLSRVFIDQVKQRDLCSVKGYILSDRETVVVHDFFGGIKKKSTFTVLPQ